MKFSKYNMLVDDPFTNQTVLFNSFTGESFTIDDEKVKKALESNNIEALDSEEKAAFTEKNIIIEDNKKEDEIFKYFYDLSKYNTSHLSATILFTWACNLRCVYCYEGAGEKRSQTMSMEDCDAVSKFLIDQAKQYRVSAISICLFGGEPLLNIKGCERVLSVLDQHCKENNLILSTSIVTNGTLIDDDVIAMLKKYHCSNIQITIDGIKEIHDVRRPSKSGESSFDKIINNLKMLLVTKDFPIPLIRINVDKDNLETTRELLNYLRTEGLGKCRIDFGIVRGETEACADYQACFTEKELGDVLESLWVIAKEEGFNLNPRPRRKFLYCGLNRQTSFTIAPTLDVYKCWEQVGDLRHKIGKIDSNGKYEENINVLADWMTINPFDNKDCSECVYLPNCGGGCAAQAYNEEGTYHASCCFNTKGVIEKELLYNLREKALL